MLLSSSNKNRVGWSPWLEASLKLSWCKCPAPSTKNSTRVPFWKRNTCGKPSRFRARTGRRPFLSPAASRNCTSSASSSTSDATARRSTRSWERFPWKNSSEKFWENETISRASKTLFAKEDENVVISIASTRNTSIAGARRCRIERVW
jgi:hypothetical protein